MLKLSLSPRPSKRARGRLAKLVGEAKPASRGPSLAKGRLAGRVGDRDEGKRSEPAAAAPLAEPPARPSAAAQRIQRLLATSRAATGTAGPPADELTENKRKAPRRPTTQRAEIIFEDLAVPIPCTVTDQSATGARVLFDFRAAGIEFTVRDIPYDVTLIFPRDRVMAACKVKWRRGEAVGLQFLTQWQCYARGVRR